MNPRVGVGVFVIKNGTFLMGKRRGSHGADTWSIPGGHLEFGESFEQTAGREVLEETGLAITNIRFGAITNDYFEAEHKHYITVWMLSDWSGGEPLITEPDKFIDMQWFAFNNLPSPLFKPWKQLLQSHFLTSIKEQL